LEKVAAVIEPWLEHAKDLAVLRHDRIKAFRTVCAGKRENGGGGFFLKNGGGA